MAACIQIVKCTYGVIQIFLSYIILFVVSLYLIFNADDVTTVPLRQCLHRYLHTLCVGRLGFMYVNDFPEFQAAAVFHETNKIAEISF
jgi:hypothetical protein